MRFGIAADFRNPQEWRKPFPSFYQDIFGQVRLAESLGFDSVWLTEHHFTDDGYNPSLLTSAAAIAAQTTTMRIASFILLLPFIHPIRAAEDIANVDIISNGRFDLGVGQGYSYHEFESFCMDRSTRASRFNECLNAIKALFTEERVSLDGKYTQFKNARLSPKPVQQPHPPIWIGARGPKAIVRAAKNGYHLMATFGPDPAPLYLETLQASGFNPQEFNVAQLRMIYLADSEDQAWDESQYHLWHLLDFYSDIASNAKDCEGDDNLLPAKSPEDIRHSVLKDVLMVGTPDQIGEKMAAFDKEFHCTDLVCYMQFPGMEVAKANRSMELFAKHIMPAFK